MREAPVTMEQMVSDIALAGAPELRQWLALAVSVGGQKVLEAIAREARNATRLHNLRLQSASAKRQGDTRKEDAVRKRMARLEARRAAGD